MSRAPLCSMLLLSLLLLFSAYNAPSSAMDCNPDDRDALLMVKAELGHPVRLSSWLPSTNCCAWDPAVFCNQAGRITGLALFSLGAVSTPVPTALGELTALEILQVDSVPGLSGPIPASFGNLTRLLDLDINGTSISGPVPSFLAGATNLSTLVIANSKLAGPIPGSLASLPNLRYVDLSGNMLTGAIPRGLLHGSFRFLLLSNNQLTGEIPADYGDGDVDTLDLSHNWFTGDPSPFLFDITKPTVKIDLSWNELEFDMTEVRFPHHLRFLDLSHNRIRGGVAKSLMDVKLEHFDVSYNDLCGEIPAGRFMSEHGADCYAHNKCLCGTPLPPCNSTGMSS
ncbi:polygalacturonase inhibitor 1-like [Phragmites australis]|uniref:polygalacturonase inhibitor 1-like n=1 Tax=Phragmites australis TaxID=29695 RepID=UPI002D769CE6|nr:polygalacturonase inhibitor 1-like [Phragmites australis]